MKTIKNNYKNKMKSILINKSNNLHYKISRDICCY